MAAEDLSDPPTTLPLYPEMILSAIEALNDKNGSNKSSITKQIESTHGPLPPAHSTLVSHHLTQMQQSGRLSLLNNNYLLPDSLSPPKRGRGRPPKPKSAISTPVGPPRPRGRPPKTDTVSAASVSVSGVPTSPGRGRGRPPKTDTVSGVSPTSGGTGRGRGRPPKRAKVVGGDVAAAVAGVKRGRGRPPKVKVAEVGA